MSSPFWSLTWLPKVASPVSSLSVRSPVLFLSWHWSLSYIIYVFTWGLFIPLPSLSTPRTWAPWKQACLVHPSIFCPGISGCEYVTLHGRRDLADVMKSRILTWRDYLDLSEWVQCNHKGHCKREAGGSESEIWQQKQRWEWCECWLWRQKEAMRQRMWAASGSWKGKETESSLQPPEGRHPSILTP